MNPTTFRLNESFVDGYRNQNPPFGFGDLGKFVFYRTYSRPKADGNNESWSDVVQRVVDETYTIQKRHAISNNRPWSEEKANRSAENMYDRIWNLKFTPPGRGLWSMGAPVTRDRGIYMSLQNCFSRDTEIITREHGIAPIGFYANEGKATVLSINGEWIEAKIKSFGVQPLRKITFRRQGVNKVVYATGNHRWFAKSQSDINHSKGWKTYTTDELTKGTRMRYFFSRSNNVLPSHTGIQHGFVFGDGGKEAAFFAEGKDNDMLKYFKGQDIQKRSFGYEIPRQPRYFKRLPDIEESTNYLMGWLMGYFAADGCCDAASGRCTISSSVENNIKFVRSICSILGIGYYSIIKQTRDTNYKDDHTMYSITLMRDTLPKDFLLLDSHKNNFKETNQKAHWNVVSVEKTNRIEEVFCAVVPEKESFALADNLATYNCAFVSTDEMAIDPSKPFRFMMDVSMLGVGCGFDTKGAGTLSIQSPHGVQTYVIPDTREGWVNSTGMLLNAFFKGERMPIFDYSKIRKEGEPIRGFGGVASGPDPLKMFHFKVTDMLTNLIGKPVTSTLIVDIMNMIGQVVVAGNVRRTAQLAIGDPDDSAYLDLKNYSLNPHRMEYGWTSNNSIAAKVGMDYSSAANRTIINGEPGYIWMDNARKHGRINHPTDHLYCQPDNAAGFNPCVEQPLESFEVCTLVETYPANHKTAADYIETLKYAYLYAKTVTLAPIHWNETNEIVEKNRRIGTSMTGIIQAIEKFGEDEFDDLCEKGYESIRYWDKVYSEWLSVNESIRVTTVKPSGTVSILAGALPGLHRAESKFYVRRVRVSKLSPLIEPAIDAGYHVEPSVSDTNSMVIEFPVAVKNVGRTLSESNIREQVEMAVRMQNIWSDNGVSITVTFRGDEGDQIPPLLNEFDDRLKAISFLPKFETGSSPYPQMPYEEITKAEYENMMVRVRSMDMSSITGSEAVGESGCTNDGCEIKFATTPNGKYEVA